MNLSNDLEHFLTKSSLPAGFHLPAICFETLSLTANDNGMTESSHLSAEYIKNIVSKIDKLEDEGKSEEAAQLEWVASLQILKYFETLNQKIDPSLALNIVSTCFKRLKFINEKRYHVNLGHFLVISELIVKFFHDIEDYKADEHRVKQKVFEQASWLLRNIEAIATFGEEVDNSKTSFQGLAIIDIIKLYFKNLTRLIEAHSNVLKQQNKVLQKKAFVLLLKYKYDKEFTNICVELISSLSHALSGSTSKSTLDLRLKLYFSNMVYLFDIFNPCKDKDMILSQFSYDQAFFLKDEGHGGEGFNLNLLFPYNDILKSNTRVPLHDACFFARSIYGLIVRALNEPLKDDLISINIFYCLKAIERVLTSDTDQVKSKKKTFDIEKGLSLEDYTKFSLEHKAFCLKLVCMIVRKFKGYMLRYLDWITNAVYYLFLNFKEHHFLFRKTIKVIQVLVNTLGLQACNFVRFLFFKGGNMFGVMEKLFVSLFVKKEESARQEEFKLTPVSKKVGKKKKGGNIGLNKEVRLQLTAQDEFAFLDSFSKNDRFKLFLSLARAFVIYLKCYGKQELDIDVIVKIDNFAEMVMTVNLKNFSELNSKELLLVASLLESIALNNINNKQESMVHRSILSYLRKFAFHFNEQEIQHYINEAKDKILAFHSSKTSLLMEHESLEEIYSYYDNKIKIMESLDKRKLEELETENNEEREMQEDEPEEIRSAEKPVKKVDTKDDTLVHDKIFESDKKAQQEQGKKTPIQLLSNNKGSVSGLRSEEKKGTGAGEEQKEKGSESKRMLFEKVTPVVLQEEATVIKVREEGGVKETVVQESTVLHIGSGEVLSQKILRTEVVESIREAQNNEEKEDDFEKVGSEGEDIEGMPKLNLDDEE